MHRAWAKVRASGLSSDSEATKQETLQFGENWLSQLERIEKQLRNGRFEFLGETGVTPPKGKGRSGVRPIVLAPIANRIVRRAILDVLQGFDDYSLFRARRWAGVPAIRAVMETPTSVGGIAKKGVPEGLSLIRNAIRNGSHWFIRSDIQNFFTRIPKSKVNRFIRDAVDDEKFAQIFQQALDTNLQNQAELEERNAFKLFPDPEIGVAQGSALSALAGNIALSEFDDRMNGRGIVCIRYIDDFILLGPSLDKVRKAYLSARSILKSMNMDVYEPSDSEARKQGKVDDGNIHNGTDVLGYRISGESFQPCRAAIKKFISKVDDLADKARHAMNLAATGKKYPRENCLHQTLVQIDKIVWSWSQSFRFTTATQVFADLDRQIDVKISKLKNDANLLLSSADAPARRRAIGVHLLRDTKRLSFSDSLEGGKG